MPSPRFSVSIIVPAYNAAATLGVTLESILAQTRSHWEVIVVDDGSTDETASLAAQAAVVDPRIRAIQQPNQGVSVARNRGVELAQHEWLLFLDADDWILPSFLERMIQALELDMTADAVHCGWSRVTADGTHVIDTHFAIDTEEMFHVAARTCPLAMHACVFRTALFHAVGGFDPSLRICEDWDLWQRLARAGARFVKVPEALALYRLTPGSLTSNADRYQVDSFRVFERGHGPDPRVTQPDPRFAAGLPVTELPKRKFDMSVWLAGLLIATGEDARRLLDYARQERVPRLPPKSIAEHLLSSLAEGTRETANQLAARWTTIQPCLDEFLAELAKVSESPGLARPAALLLEEMVYAAYDGDEPVNVGTLHACSLELTAPIDNIVLPAPVERLYLTVRVQGDKYGVVQLPVIDGVVHAWVIRDAIACDFGWRILGQYFAQHVYTSESADDHNQIGWGTFLQQLWNCPGRETHAFYDPHFAEEDAQPNSPCKIEGDAIRIEVSAALPDVSLAAQVLHATATVGGVVLLSVGVPVSEGRVTAQALRTAITTAGGIELCRAVVREALVGVSWDDESSLRQRLSRTAKQATQSGTMPRRVVLGRRSGPIDSSVSRRACLPPAAAAELLEMSQIAREPCENLLAAGESIDRIDYDPAVIGLATSDATWANVDAQTNEAARVIAESGREHFENLFAESADPWKYTSPYEQTKYEQTLSLVPKNVTRALELGCAEGHFSVQLAPRVRQLLVADISRVALQRAAERCRGHNNVEYRRVDITKDEVPGKFDLIVCSEVLYYFESLAELRSVADKFASALAPGGSLVMAHAHQVIDAPTEPGFDWGLQFGAKGISDVFGSVPSLQLTDEIRTPMYRVQRFRKRRSLPIDWLRPGPRLVELPEQPTELPADVAGDARWNGGTPSTANAPSRPTTATLPILMYHRVAPAGSELLAPYRVTPTAFAEQMEYLHDTGFTTATWREWTDARAARRPLPGRRFVLTFDDGYQDFHDHAWPVLKKFGFTASVFLVADQIGKSNVWDNPYGEQIPLMDWPAIRELQAAGIEFGSHTVSHPQLAALSPLDVVREAARSRSHLQRKLDRSVTSIAYPFGDTNRIVQHLCGACGYVVGLTCRPGAAQWDDPLIALPRIEICGSDELADFVLKVKGKR